MRLPSDERVRDFLALTLGQWGLAVAVEAGEDPVVAWLRLGGAGRDIAIERAEPHDPFRWYVHRTAGTAGAVRRPCGSLVGVLGALRRLLDIDAGGRARVVA